MRVGRIQPLECCAAYVIHGRVPPVRTDTYPSDQRASYLAGVDLVTALRIRGALIELPLLVGQLVFTLGREGDLRVDHKYLASLHVRLERVGAYVRVENISADRKNPIIFDNREVSECYIKPGDQFRIGDTVYYAVNDEMRVARRTISEILGETADARVDDCLIAAASDANKHIVVVGQPGSDQERLGTAIHLASTRRRNSNPVIQASRVPGSVDPQCLRDARDGTLMIWLPKKGRFDTKFAEHVNESEIRCRLIIFTPAAGRVVASFPSLNLDNAKWITIPTISTRKDELAVLMDRWFVEQRSPLRFRMLSPKIQEKLLVYRWPNNLHELREAVDNLILLTHYKSEREAANDTSLTRSESRTWRKRLKLPLPITTIAF
jgi:hypothetical protein